MRYGHRGGSTKHVSDEQHIDFDVIMAGADVEGYGKLTGEQVLAMRSIAQAHSHYLAWAFGESNTNDESFFEAATYFFAPLTKCELEFGQIFSRAAIEFMSLEFQFELSGLGNFMSLDRFRAKLKSQRRKALVEHEAEVRAYLDSRHEPHLRAISHREDMIELLVDPLAAMERGALVAQAAAA